MAKLTTIVFLLIGVELLFLAGGVTTDGSSTLLSMILNPSTITASALFSISNLAIIMVVAGGIIAGTMFFRPDMILVAPIAGFFIALVPLDMLMICGVLNDVFNFTTVGGFNIGLGTFLIAPLMIITIISIADWWRTPLS